MAIITTPNTTNKYHDLASYNDVINYILQPYKTIHHHIGSIGLNPLDPAGSMRSVAEQFGKTKGVHVRHFIVAFDPWEPITPEIADQIGRRIIQYLGREFQALYAVHEDEPQLGGHIYGPENHPDCHRHHPADHRG